MDLNCLLNGPLPYLQVAFPALSLRCRVGIFTHCWKCNETTCLPFRILKTILEQLWSFSWVLCHAKNMPRWFKPHAHACACPLEWIPWSLTYFSQTSQHNILSEYVNISQIQFFETCDSVAFVSCFETPPYRTPIDPGSQMSNVNQTLMTCYYTDWFIGIHAMAYYNPYSYI